MFDHRELLRYLNGLGQIQHIPASLSDLLALLPLANDPDPDQILAYICSLWMRLRSTSAEWRVSYLALRINRTLLGIGLNIWLSYAPRSPSFFWNPSLTGRTQRTRARDVNRAGKSTSDSACMRIVYDRIKKEGDKRPDREFLPQVKDATSQYRKDRLTAMRWYSIVHRFGWKFVILAEQIQHSWILFDEPRYVHSGAALTPHPHPP